MGGFLFFNVMLRQDIQIDTDYGELETADNIIGKMNYGFRLLGHIDEQDNDNYCYGEVLIPRGFEKRIREGFKIYIRLPYRSLYKELKVRLRVDSQNGMSEYVLNRNTNNQWYCVVMPDGDKIRISEFRTLGSEEIYNLVLSNGAFLIYSGHETDLLIKPSLPQNQNFLLKASAGTLYQHPLTGVGLIDFLHGNFENSGLATKLQNEFKADNMIVVNAYMNSETGELLLEVKEKNG